MTSHSRSEKIYTPVSLKTVQSSRETEAALVTQQFDLTLLDNSSIVIGQGAWGVKQWERSVALG